MTDFPVSAEELSFAGSRQMAAGDAAQAEAFLREALGLAFCRGARPSPLAACPGPAFRLTRK